MNGILIRSVSAIGVLVLTWLPLPALGGGTVVSWCGLPTPCIATNAVAISSGYAHDLLLKEDGTVADCGMFFVPAGAQYVPIVVPPTLTDVVAVAAGVSYSLALKNDGTVAIWQADNPLGLVEVPTGLSNVVAITQSAALKADGTVVPWGAEASAIPGLDNVVAYSSGPVTLALKADGTVVGWGGAYGVSTNSLAGLSNVVAISAGSQEWLALKADGTVVGEGNYGIPPGMSNVVAIAASQGWDHHVNLALKSDGTVVGWGYNFCGGPTDPTVPPGLSNVVAVSSWGNSLALIGDRPPVRQVPLSNPTTSSNAFTVFLATQSGRVYRLEYKEALSDANWKALPLVAGNGHVRELTDPAATSGQRFYRVRQW